MRNKNLVDCTDFNFDDPTPQETAWHQCLAQQMQETADAEKLAEENDARLLRRAEESVTYEQRVEWLRLTGHTGARINGHKGTIPFDQIPHEDRRYVYAMFQRKVGELRGFLEQQKPY